MISKVYENVKKFIKENYKFILFIIGMYIIMYAELPYVIETPGGSINLNDRVKVEDGYDQEGTLEMAYVSMVKGSIPFVAASFIIPNWDLVSKDDIKYDGETMDDMMTRDKLYLSSAIDNATISAFKEAGKEIEIKKHTLNIGYVDKEASQELKIGDIVKKIDDKEISGPEDLRNYLKTKSKDDNVKIEVLRGKKSKVIESKLIDTEDGLKIGISLISTYELETDPDVSVKVKSSEAGPSGGLMTSLMIYNKLTKEDITKGRKIIGTGTIDEKGNVGVIGGVKYKLLGASKHKAKIFLCPKDNLKEALEVKEKHHLKIEIKGVSTLNEAIEYLRG